MSDNTPPSQGPPDPHAAGPGGVDVRKLADKVYRLMQADARLGHARGARSIAERLTKVED